MTQKNFAAAFFLIFSATLFTASESFTNENQITAVQSFTATDDAFVRSANPTGNYGSHGELRVRRPHSDIVISYLKFNVSGLSGQVQQAKIRLLVLDGSVDGGSIYSVSNNLNGSVAPWMESTVVYDNAPPITGSPLSSAGTVTTGSLVEFDVTAAVTGNGVFSFAVANQHNDLVNYSSKEGSQAPELVIETSGGSTPNPPVISSFTPTSGPVGTEVTIVGDHFVNVSQVLFNGAAASPFFVDSPTQIRAAAPAGATSGVITVSTSDGSALSSSPFTVTPSGGGSSTASFFPTDDSFVRSNYPSRNYGSTFDLRVRKTSSADFITYLKFNVTGLSGAVQQAKLRLHVIDSSVDGGSIFWAANHFQGTTTSWNEEGLNYGNAPELKSGALSQLGSVNLNEVVEFDVTSAINGNGVFSFAIRSATNDLANYSSKEGVQAPELVIHTSGDSEPPPPPPVITSFSPTSGQVGVEVTISGSGFTGANSVAFNGLPASTFAVDTDSQVRATVPAGATTGPITIKASSGTAASSQDFVVTEPDPDPDPDPGPSETFTFIPVEDSFIRSNYPTNNYGGAQDLRVRKTSSADFISYLKFNVTGLSHSVSRAMLRLLVIDGSSDGGAAFSVSNHFNGTSTPWKEDDLDAVNAPAVAGSPLSSQGAVSLNQLVEFDVTAAISGDGVYSFALKSSTNDLANYSSKEGVQSPQLVIETGEGNSLQPIIASFSPASGGVGTEVTILGANFTGSTSGGANGTVRIMPLGDSITQGVHGSTDNAGYRNDLADLLSNNSVSFNFVGTRNHGSGFDSDHEGHSGYRADEILAELNSYLNSNPPDLILLHIGTNDISELQTPASTVNEISAILDAIKTFDVSIAAILSSVIPRSDSKNGATNTLNNYIRDLIPVKQNSGHNVFYAGMNEAFVANSSWATQYLADGVHPNDAGYGVMAAVWRDAILDALGVSPGLTVAFNGVTASSITIDSETRIRAVVPAGASTGKISVTSVFGTGFSDSDFVVTSPILTFKQGAAAPSLMEIEQMVLGKLASEPRGDVDGSGAVDLVDVLHVMDGDGASSTLEFSQREWTDAEARSALRVAPTSALGNDVLSISLANPIALRGFFLQLKFDPAKIHFASPLTIENDHHFLVRSHVTENSISVLGYLKRAGQSVAINDVLIQLPLGTQPVGLNPEDVTVSRVVLVAPKAAPQTQEPIAEGETLPTEFALLQNYPNPFNAGTEIKFDLPQRARLTLRIFNIKGELVRTLVDEERDPGRHRVHWDGKNEQGSVVASGVYVYRMQTSRWEASRKLTMVK